MTRRVVVAGTGKMARNIGRWLARKRWGVTFASGSAERLVALEQWARKRMRHAFADADPSLAPRMLLITPDGAAPDPAGSPGPVLDGTAVVIEASTEERAHKAQLLTTLERWVRTDTLLTSTSSSILPSELHPACLGLHFFYPVELTGCVELVLPAHTSAPHAQQARALCAELELRCIGQNESNAFMANRLLLPLQAECARALLAGGSPEAVDAASVSELLPVGQLALMDSVGLDVLAQSVRRYLGRMDADRAEALRPLERMLQPLVEAGRLGSKSGSGLLVGGPLPWTPTPAAPPPNPLLLRALFVNAYLGAVDRAELDRDSLEAIVDGIYGGAHALARVLHDEAHSMVELLEDLFVRTGAWYCSPAPSLRAAGP